MPILPLVDQKQLNADSIISPIVELPESRKLSVTPGRSPVDNPSRYNPNSTYAPGIDPNTLYTPDTKPETSANVMHTYPPPQMMPYKNQQPAQTNGYGNYASTGTTHYPSQTYPGLQEPPKQRNGYANGLQIPGQPFHSGNLQNGVSQYGMSPVPTVQQQQSMYTDSPVDTTAFPSYYTQEPQNLTADMSNMAYDTANYQQQGTYQAMSYLTQQHNYQYQNQ